MTELEAIKLASRLRQLIRTMNEEQERTAAKLILAFDAGTVFECVEEHAKNCDFFNMAKFMELVRLRSRGDPALDAMKEKGLREYRQAAETERQRLSSIDQEHAKQDALIAEFSDADLATLKEMAIANCGRDENTKAFMRTKDARTSRLLKSMIFTALQATGEVPS